MAQLFADERKYPDNRPRANFVFLGYPFAPPVAQEDYRTVVKEIQEEFPIRLWYFLDEITTTEMMRKIWRAILRSDLAIFDISGGNPNVAFELGLAVADAKQCFTILKTGEANPLGGADLGYAERAEYSSVATLKDTLRRTLLAKSTALRAAKEASFQIYDSSLAVTREDIEKSIRTILQSVFENRRITKTTAERLLSDRRMADVALNQLRAQNVLQVEGQKRGAKWVFTDAWVHADHEFAGA